ncbi:hypothetical protein Tco_1559279, partial [Tanacetum coccineum]
DGEEGSVFVCDLTFNQREEKRVRENVNSGYVVENVLMGCGRAYVGNEGNNKYNKYKESELCKGMKYGMEVLYGEVWEFVRHLVHMRNKYVSL